MRVFVHILLTVILGMIAWISAFVYSTRVLEMFGIQGGYHIRHGNEEGIVFGFLLLIGFGFSTILNGLMGYWIAKTSSPLPKRRLYLGSVALLIFIPIITTYIVYVIDHA